MKNIMFYMENVLQAMKLGAYSITNHTREKAKKSCILYSRDSKTNGFSKTIRRK